MVATLIRNGIVLPMTGRGNVLDPGSVLIDGGEIHAVGPVLDVDHHPLAAEAEIIDASDHAVLPGLHNTHMHSGLLRGTAESMSLWDWLKTYVDPAHRALTPEIAEIASRQCYAESLLATLDAPIDRIIFTNSGSESNDLALRIANQHSGSRGLLISDFSYHGHTHALALATTGLVAHEGLGAHVRPIRIPDLDAADAGRDEREVLAASLAEVAKRYVECLKFPAHQGGRRA